MSDITVILDDVTFQDFEVPDHINFGGQQMLKVHKLLGGKRVIDAMGSDDDPMEWSGRFRGSDAVSRANTLDAKRRAGKPLNLSWGELSFTVVIAHFAAIYENPFEVPYKITVEVVEEQPLQEDPGIDEMALGDQADADAAVSEIGDAGLTTDMGSLDTAMGGIGSFETATPSAISSVIDTVSTVQSRVTSMIEGAEANIAGLVPLGVPHANIASQLAAQVMGQVSYLAQDYRLYDLENSLGRLTTNLAVQAGTFDGSPAISGLFRPAGD